MRPELDWRVRAACRTEDPELFFGLTVEDQERAVAVCRRCPVTATCRQWADERDIVYGVWAGETEEQRRTRLAGDPAGEGSLAVCEQCRRGFRRRRSTQRFCSHQCHHASMARGVGSGRPRSDCGTTGAARRHRKRGEPMDDACRMAESLYRVQLRTRRQQEAGVSS